MNFFWQGLRFSGVCFPGMYQPYVQMVRLLMNKCLLVAGLVLGTRDVVLSRTPLCSGTVQTFGGDQNEVQALTHESLVRH